MIGLGDSRQQEPDPAIEAAKRREGMLHNLMGSWVHHWNQVWAMQRAVVAKHEGLPLEPYSVPLPGHSTASNKINVGIGLPAVAAIIAAILLAAWLMRAPGIVRDSGGIVRDSSGIAAGQPGIADRDWIFGLIKDED